MSPRSHHSRSSSTIDDLETISVAFTGLSDPSPLMKTLSTLFGALDRSGKAKAKDLRNDIETQRILRRVHSGETHFLEAFRWCEKEYQRGYEFCNSMVKICDIFGTDNVDTEGLQVLVEETQKHAKELQVCSEHVVQEFNRVRHRLLRIGGQIPSAVDNLVQKQKTIVNKRQIAEKRVAPLKLVKAGTAAASGVIGVIAGVGSIAFPPALVVIPVVLPLIVLLGGFLEVKNNKRIEKCEIEEQKIREAMTQLEAASGSLGLMDDHLDQFINFWMEIELMLQGINQRLEDVEYPIPPIRLSMIKDGFMNAQNKYKDYYMEIKKLYLLYPDSASEDSSSRNRISSRTSSTATAHITKGCPQKNATKLSSTLSSSSSNSVTDRPGSRSDSGSRTSQSSKSHRSRH